MTKMNFELHSDYKPTGDQPQAIKELVEGFKAGNQFETLLGVTGSGKIHLKKVRNYEKLAEIIWEELDRIILASRPFMYT